MTRTRQWTRLLAVISVLAMVLAACGGGGDTEDTGADTTEAAADTTAAPETTAAPDTTAAETTEASETTMAETTMAETTAAPETTMAAGATCTGESNGVLEVGGLLPETGNLAFLGPPEFAAAQMAANEINENGGVLGEDVVWSPGDSSDNGDVANQTVDRHLNAGVDMILGAASSGVSFTVIDKITQACKIHFSPANTSPDFTTYEDGGMYFRTAPSDVLQGQVLADLIVSEGHVTVGAMALQDPYGEGLLQYSTESLTAQGAEVVESFVYDPQAQTFDPEVQRMVAADPDAIILIGFDESSQILAGFFEAGITQENTGIYLVDGNVGNALGERMPQDGVLSGIKGTLPAAETTDDFRNRLLEIDSELIDFSYSPETYDAFVITALAAEIAGTDDPAAVANEIIGVTRDGEKCSTFTECRDMIADGTDIDFDGPSGPQTFGPAGEPSEASFAILQYGENSNEIDDSLTEYRFAAIDE